MYNYTILRSILSFSYWCKY